MVHAFGEEVTTLGPNALMTQRSYPFDLSFNLWSPTAHDDRLPQGEYDFPFEFALPAALPPTFNGEFTRILYVVAAKSIGRCTPTCITSTNSPCCLRR